MAELAHQTNEQRQEMTPKTEATGLERALKAPPPDIPKNDFDITALVQTAGTLKLTDPQEAALYAPVVEDDIEIRPDGLIYMPWMEYVTRLREAFGMEWAIIPQGMPRLRGDLVIWGFYLIVQGVYCSYAMGEQLYQPDNRTMSYGDAIEGAKSNALMRLCKGIGISLELWRPKFIKKWIADNAESYICQSGRNKGKTLWRKKGQVVKEEKTETPPQQVTGLDYFKSIYVSLTEEDKALYLETFKYKYGDLTPEGQEKATAWVNDKIVSYAKEE